MSIIRKINRKQKKAYNKASNLEKAQIIKSQIDDKIIDTVNKNIADSFVLGATSTYKILAENYVIELLETKDEDRQQELISALLAEIMTVYNKTKNNIESEEK